MPQLLSTRIDVGNGRIMVDGLGVERTDNGDFISNRSDIGQQITIDPRTMTAVALELEHGGHTWKGLLSRGHPCQSLTLPYRFGQFDTMNFLHGWLVVIQVYVGRATREKQKDDSLGCRGEVNLVHGSRVGERRATEELIGSAGRGQPQGPHSRRTEAQELSSIQRMIGQGRILHTSLSING